MLRISWTPFTIEALDVHMYVLVPFNHSCPYLEPFNFAGWKYRCSQHGFQSAKYLGQYSPHPQAPIPQIKGNLVPQTTGARTNEQGCQVVPRLVLLHTQHMYAVKTVNSGHPWDIYVAVIYMYMYTVCSHMDSCTACIQVDHLLPEPPPALIAYRRLQRKIEERLQKKFLVAEQASYYRFTA